jgi:hypothetical protein
MLQRCPSCRGSKKVIQLGYIEKNCAQCAGVGKVKQEPSFDSISKVVDVFKKYPENPEEHYKEAIEASNDRYSESLSVLGGAHEVKHKVSNEKPKNLKGSSSHGKERKGK